jgi:hypothetical protein
MMKNDQISAIGWGVLGLFISIHSIRELPLGTWHNPGPGFLPLGAGMVLTIFSAGTFLSATLSPSVEPREALFPAGKRKNILLVLAALFGYAMTMETLGFLLSTFGLLYFLYQAFEPQKRLVAILVSLLGAFISYAVFEWWLQTNLPKGILGL